MGCTPGNETRDGQPWYVKGIAPADGAHENACDLRINLASHSDQVNEPAETGVARGAPDGESKHLR
jgi:hypothetical protein